MVNTNKGINKHPENPETCVKPENLEELKEVCNNPQAWINGDKFKGASNTGKMSDCDKLLEYEKCDSKSRSMSNVASVVNNSKGSTNAVNVFNNNNNQGGKAKKGGMMLIKQALIPAALTASAISYKKKKSQKGGLLALGANNAAVATLVAARMSMKNKNKNKKGGKKTRGKKVKGRKPKRKGTRKK